MSPFIFSIESLEPIVFLATLVLLGAAKGGSGWKKMFGLGKKDSKSSASTVDPELAAGDWERAAKVFEEEGRYRDAAKLYRGKGQHHEAARLLVRAGALTEAASIFERVGHYQKAAEVCAQFGDNKRAGENCRRYLQDKFNTLADARSPADHAEFTKYCRLAGQAFERAGLHEQAAEVLERGEQWEDAAGLFLKLNRHVKAADLYERAGAVDHAANAYAQAGDRVRAAQMRGEHLYKQDQKNEAAVQFLLGGDPLRAAEVYEEAENYLDSARCYEHCGAHRQAAEAYERVGQLDRAAEMYGRSQDYQRAAALYEKADDWGHAARMFAESHEYYRASKNARKAGLTELAIDCLQKIEPTNPRYQESLVEPGQSLMERDLPGVAVEKLKKALHDQPLTAKNLDIYYTLAVAFEQMGGYEDATKIFKQVVAENYSYRDAVGRLQELDKRPAKKATEPSLHQAAREELGGKRYEFIEKIGAGRDGRRLSRQRHAAQSHRGLQDAHGAVHGCQRHP